MRIGMILDNEFPPDNRPEKEALSLIAAGHRVSLLCPTFSDQKLVEDYKNIRVVRFKLSKELRNKLRPLYLVLPFYRKIWDKQIQRFLANEKFDALHLHDLPLSDVALKYARKYGLKLICDQHEYYSDWIVTTAHYNTTIGKIIKRFSDWKRYERKYLNLADMVLTVEEPLREIYIKEVGIPPEKIISVPNTPSAEIFISTIPDDDLRKKYQDKFVLFYAGSIDSLRGLDMVVKALPRLRRKIPNILFVLAGKQHKYFDPLELARSLGVGDLIEFVGYLSVERIPAYLHIASICVHTPKATRVDSNHTIATKIYQYAASGKPMIVTQAKMMKDFVEQNGLGVTVPYGDVDAFVAAVTNIFNNYDQTVRKVKANSEKLLNSKRIFWEGTVQGMVAYYNKLEKQLREHKNQN